MTSTTCKSGQFPTPQGSRAQAACYYKALEVEKEFMSMNFRSSVQTQLPRTVCVDNTREQPRQRKREIRQEPGKSRNQEDGYSTGSLSEEHEDVFARLLGRN